FAPPPSRACWSRHRAPPATRPVAIEPPSSPLPFPTIPRRRHGLCWPKNAEKPRELAGTSTSSISLLRPPFSSTQAPGPGRPVRETFRRSIELGPGAVACTRHPPPGHRDFRAF
ncbi:hypothetical protein Prudu_001780, partial [Prunus dulcis]